MDNGTELSLPLEINAHQDVVVGQKVGYARVSSLEQNLDRQLEQLQAAGASQIYKEKISGSTRHRRQLEEILRYLRRGDQCRFGVVGTVCPRSWYRGSTYLVPQRCFLP